MHSPSVGIFGASGFSGLELTRILAAHPKATVRFVSSDRYEGQPVGRYLPVSGPVAQLRYVSPRQAEELAAGCDAVLLATPAEASLALAPKLLAAKVRVVDLSGAFRLADAASYPAYYGFAHAHPELLARAVYGLTELSREQIRGALLVANPGCYPTAAALALSPLLKAGLLEAGSIIVNAASGVSGAGRKATEDFAFMEVDGDFRAYKVLKHQHTPEIAQTLARSAGAPVPLTFTPHLLPMKRGILSTAYAKLKAGRDAAELHKALWAAYGDEAFVQVLEAPEAVNLKSVVGTNRCQVAVACDTQGLDKGRVVVVSSIDNLLKGAAGQAVQNLNLMLGLEETCGLTSLRGFYP